jgi:hypothetical protein
MKRHLGVAIVALGIFLVISTSAQAKTPRIPPADKVVGWLQTKLMSHPVGPGSDAVTHYLTHAFPRGRTIVPNTPEVSILTVFPGGRWQACRSAYDYYAQVVERVPWRKRSNEMRYVAWLVKHDTQRQADEKAAAKRPRPGLPRPNEPPFRYNGSFAALSAY